MIGRLTGRIESVALGTIIVDVHGVGYEVNIPDGLVGRLDVDPDHQSTIYVHTSVRDDAIDLYGFASDHQRELFTRLTSVSRIGPKTALSVLSGMDPPEIVRAVRSNEIDSFKSVKGIGEKTAQRLILELKNSLDDLEFDELAPPQEVDVHSERLQDLRSALENFGYESSEIDAVVESLGSKIEEADGVEPLVRQALALLRE